MPNHIKYFEWSWLASIVLGIIVSGLTYSELTDKLDPVSVGIIQFLVLAFTITLVLLISRKKSNFAKLTLLFLYPVGLYFYIPQLSDLFLMGMAGVISSIQLILQSIGLYFLFTPEAKQWFQDNTLTPPIEVSDTNTITPKRSLFGKIVKWIFIGFNIIMLLCIILIVSSVDGFDPSSIHTIDDDTFMHLMIAGTGMYLAFFVWVIGDIILGVLVLCTRPK